MFSLLTIKIRSVIFSKCQSGQEGHCSDLGNLFLSFLATLGNRVWFHFRWHARFCFRLPVTRGENTAPLRDGASLMMTETETSVSRRSVESSSQSPLMSQLPNNHITRKIIVFHPRSSSQCLLKFNLLRAWPCKSSRNKHNWIRQRRSNTRLCCYLQASQSFLVSFNNVVLTERGNVSMYLRSARSFIWKIRVIK